MREQLRERGPPLVGFLLLIAGACLLCSPAWAQEAAQGAQGISGDALVGVGATATTSGGILLAGWQFVTRKLNAIEDRSVVLEQKVSQALDKHGESLELVRELLGLLKLDVEANRLRRDERQEIGRQVAELHKWHDKTDQDGVPVWYVRSTIEQAILALSANVEKQTDVFRELANEIRGTSRRKPGTNGA